MRPSHDENIPHNECWDLLKSQSLGRVALSVAALPAIVPVAYSVDGDELTISLDPHQTLPEKAFRDAVVAFEVDTIDPATHHGWIVHVTGSACLTATEDGDGAVARTVQLVPAIITGQRVQSDGRHQ